MVLREFRKRFCRKRPALFKSGQWHFQQDNAPVHNSILVTDYTRKMGIKTVPHRPYSPDLAIKLCLKLGKYATETHGMLQTAFRPSCMNQASDFEWQKRFKEGRESVRDDEKCWRSKEVNKPELIGQRVKLSFRDFSPIPIIQISL